MLKLFVFHADWGRMGTVESVFMGSEEDVAKMYGKTVYLGDILGKHSDVSVDIDEDSFEVHKIDEATIAILLKIFGHHISGCDLLGTFMDYMEEGYYDE